MRVIIAWRILSHEVARSVLAVLGLFAAIVLVFLQLGFYGSVPRGSMMVYDALDFDIALTSRDYAFQVRSHHFPRRRLLQALALPEVESATPYYQSFGRWLNDSDRLQREVFVMGFDPDRKVFRDPAIQGKAVLLKRPDTILVDDSTRREFGKRNLGARVEISNRATEIVGDYSLGTGFLGLGVILVSDQTFVRIFPKYGFDDVHVGLIRLFPGSDAEVVAARLRTIMPGDTRVFTSVEFRAHEQNYWLNATSTGLIFGFGTVVAGIVGLVILFQTLSTLIQRNLREYAVMKAMGYSTKYLTSIVASQSLLIAAVAFVPALVAAYGLYDLTRTATNLPVYMTVERLLWVFVATLTTAGWGALLTHRILKRADPADMLF